MRRRAVVTAAALPLAVGLLLSAGAGNAASAPLGSSPAVAPAEGGHDEHTGMTGHGSAVSQPSATPTATATSRPNPTPSGTSTTMEDCTCGLPGDHSTHGDHANHDHGADADHGDHTDQGDHGEHAGHGDHGTPAPQGGHDDHGGGASTDDHGSHGSSPVTAPSDGTRAVVLGGFSAVNGSALVAAAVLRRRTASRRERHVTARAAAAPARPGTERSPR